MKTTPKQVIRFSMLVSTMILSMTAGRTKVFAQDPTAGNTRVTWLQANRFYASKYYGEGSDNEDDYTWWFWYEGAGHGVDREHHLCIEYNWDFDKKGQENPPGWLSLYSQPIVDGGYITLLDPYTEDHTLGMEGYEDDAGERCDYNTKDDKDDGVCIGYKTIHYGDYPPGVMNTEQIYCNDWGLEFQFRYDVPKPHQPEELYPAADGGNICTSGNIPLTAQTYVNPTFNNDSRFRFELVWEYSTSIFGPWNTFAITKPYFDYSTPSPRSEADFSFNLFKNINANTVFYYRVTTKMTVLTGTIDDFAGKVFMSVPSSYNTMNISPVAPAFTITDNVASCPNADNSTGKISASVSGFGDYLYSLSTSYPAGCDPKSPNCGGQASHFQSNTLEITSIAAGSYYLRIANYPGINGDRGVCNTIQQVMIGALPLLEPQTPDITKVSCPGGSDGALQIKYSGGVEPWAYHLAKTGYDADSDDGSFSALPTGTYTSSVTDGCQQLITNTVTVPEPLRITAETTPMNPTCTAPFNGGVKVDITQGEGTYSFKVLHNGDAVDEQNALAADTWTAEDLSDGAFTVEIRDAQRLQCDATTLPVTLDLPKAIKLLQEDIAQKNLTCFEQNDGYIALSNVDIGGTFKYTITGQTIGTQRELTTAAKFDNLPADSYHIVALRNVDECTDAVDIGTPVELTQPEKIVITLNKTDVKCFDDGNGQVIPVVKGGSESDQYLWETLLEGDWATFTSGRTTLENLSPGTYRLRITNASNCHGQSDEIIVDQPNLLTIANVEVQDITCYGDPGAVKVDAKGGVLPYVYHYEVPAGPLNSGTPRTTLAIGTYQLTVIDANGCVISHEPAISITAPPQSLSLAYTVSQFNGYNISCAGASNGWVDFNASGGNGGAYTGYQYALNDRPYQDMPRFENMSPGPHTLFVRDGRGCAVSKYVTFLEPASEIHTRLLSKDNVRCQNDLTGQLTIETTGGVAPYSYIANDTITQNAGVFTGLPAGSYTIVIADVNGCSTTYHDDITTRFEPIVIGLTKTDVTCHAGSNGSITADVTGGEGALQQQWNQGLTPVNNIDHLKVGQYVLTVTDAAGCSLRRAIWLSEPTPIIGSGIPIPVCVGKATGEIRVEATGGTGAHRYSTDGNTYQNEPVLKNLPAGNYQVRIRDANQCEITFASEITVRNDQPKPDFLVASKQNALDTLVVNEISVPKPDSVVWAFDPAITVVQEDDWAPQIMVAEAGEYAIAMTGYFGGCDYTSMTTINLEPYNPDNKIKIPAPYETIQTMTATPNPTDGEFDLVIALNAKQNLSVTVIDFLGVEHYRETWQKTKGVNQKINIKNAQLAPGIYIVRAVTDTDAQEVRILINGQ